MTSYNEDQRRELLSFVQGAALIEVVAWQSPDEDVVTMSKSDCDRLIAMFDEARALVAKYAGLPF